MSDNIPDYLNTTLTERELAAMSSLGLAHIGDAVFELMVRTLMTTRGVVTAKKLHRATVGYVSARAQSAAMSRILPLLTDSERETYIRGRNAHVKTVPRGASHAEYHAATGLEALFGYLYLKGNIDRVNALFDIVIDESENAEGEADAT
ncbi:MAG: ribonuclease III [Oscillospiraceae bacterium]|jgi:ribonuclease-3 family protein|nr:ribonuclease III [Oscillospiraceae bacterium]